MRNVGIIKQYFQKKYIEKMSNLLELNLDEAMELIIKRQTDKVNRATEYLNELKTNPIKRRKELDELYRTYYCCMRKRGEMRMTYLNKKNELIKEFDERNGMKKNSRACFVCKTECLGDKWGIFDYQCDHCNKLFCVKCFDDDNNVKDCGDIGDFCMECYKTSWEEYLNRKNK